MEHNEEHRNIAKKSQAEINDRANRNMRLVNSNLTALERQLEAMEEKISGVALSLKILIDNLRAMINGTFVFNTEGSTSLNGRGSITLSSL